MVLKRILLYWIQFINLDKNHRIKSAGMASLVSMPAAAVVPVDTDWNLMAEPSDAAAVAIELLDPPNTGGLYEWDPD